MTSKPDRVLSAEAVGELRDLLAAMESAQSLAVATTSGKRIAAEMAASNNLARALLANAPALLDAAGRVRELEAALNGLCNALEITPGPRGVLDLVPGAVERARAALRGQQT